ncbi:MAG: pilus assembly protein PilP [Gammaproteobacteria bacterium]|nr:pilus assembly protein PilP [Gammaproteobacteria bacterium]
MQMEQRMHLMVRFIPVLLSLTLVACGGGMQDLEDYIAEVNSRKGGRIEPLPQIKPYETYDYSVAGMRSPFEPDLPDAQESAPMGPSPVKNRNKEYLEQFPLDTLLMVGTLERDESTYALVQTNDGLVHRVQPGNYVGQNEGRIVSITESRIEVEELVTNGLGGFFTRSAGIGID